MDFRIINEDLFNECVEGLLARKYNEYGDSELPITAEERRKATIQLASEYFRLWTLLFGSLKKDDTPRWTKKSFFEGGF